MMPSIILKHLINPATQDIYLDYIIICCTCSPMGDCVFPGKNILHQVSHVFMMYSM